MNTEHSYLGIEETIERRADGTTRALHIPTCVCGWRGKPVLAGWQSCRIAAAKYAAHVGASNRVRRKQ